MTNIETGDTILSSLLTAHEFKNINIDVLMTSGITKQWFVTPVQEDIFEVVNICYNAGKAFDENIIIQYLSKKDIPNPEMVILNILAQKPVSQLLILEYINNLRKDYQKRILLQLNEETSKMLNTPDCDADAVKLLIENTLSDYDFLNDRGDTQRLSNVRKERKLKPPRKRIKTHIPFIDTVFTDKNGDKGVKCGSLGFISGLKESGKTYTITRMIENISKDHPTHFGSLEFGKDDYDEGVEEKEEEGYWQGNIDNIHIFDKTYDVNKIIAEIRFTHKLYGTKIVFLDSMLRMTNNTPDLVTDTKRLSDMFSKLGKLAKELDIPIVIIVQSSKEDLKSSIVSVKGCMDADHEAYWWYHIYKTDTKNPEDERRTVVWVKNKDTKKHPKQFLMFVPQTKDFYRFEPDENGHPLKALDKYRRPPAKPVEVVYESTPVISASEAVTGKGTSQAEMPYIDNL